MNKTQPRGWGKAGGGNFSWLWGGTNAQKGDSMWRPPCLRRTGGLDCATGERFPGSFRRGGSLFGLAVPLALGMSIAAPTFGGANRSGRCPRIRFLHNLMIGAAADWLCGAVSFSEGQQAVRGSFLETRSAIRAQLMAFRMCDRVIATRRAAA